jgi:hypothetical protein
MFEPGDWVLPTAEWGTMRADLVAQIVESNTYWAWVRIDGIEDCWPVSGCRKLSEHELMERLNES